MLREIKNNSNRRGSANPTKRFNIGGLKKRLNKWRGAALKFSEISDREYNLIRNMIKENRKNLTKDEIKRIYQLLSKCEIIIKSFNFLKLKSLNLFIFLTHLQFSSRRFNDRIADNPPLG